jgi:IS66 C-terminal element
MVRVSKSVLRRARSKVHRCWRRWKRGCVSSALGCQTRPPSPSRSTTCCAAGTGLPASSRTGRICLTNNAAERALLGRKSWLFAGSERGADRAAVMATLIMTAKLNNIDPQAWLADVLARLNDHAIHRLDELLPWNWAAEMERRKLAA